MSMDHFSFGDSDQLAQMYYDSTVGRIGPSVPSVHPDEMSHADLINCFVYVAMAATQAARDENIEVAQALHEWYDQLFLMLVEVDDKFRKRLLTGRYLPFKAGFNRNKGYYLKLAGIV